jgi:hypothetical protein
MMDSTCHAPFLCDNYALLEDLSWRRWMLLKDQRLMRERRHQAVPRGAARRAGANRASDDDKQLVV